MTRPPVGEVGTLDRVVCDELVVLDLGVGQQLEARLDRLTEVVRRNARRHPDRDARPAVHEQVRVPRRQDDGLFVRAVVVRPERNGAVLDVVEQRQRGGRETALRVPIRCRGIAVDRTEVAVPVDERVAHRPRLGEPDERVVERGVAVRVEVT